MKALIRKDNMDRAHVKDSSTKSFYFVVFSDLTLENKFCKIYPQYVYNRNEVTNNGGVTFNRYIFIPKRKYVDILLRDEKFSALSEFDIVKLLEVNDLKFPTIKSYVDRDFSKDDSTNFTNSFTIFLNSHKKYMS